MSFFRIALIASALTLAGCPDDDDGNGDTGSDTETTADTAPVDTTGDDGGGDGGADTSPDTETPPDDTGDDTAIDAEDATFGLDDRPANSSCTAPPRPPSDASINLEESFSNVELREPIWMEQAPDDASTWYLVQQSGQIKTFDNDPNASESTTFVDISDRVRSGGERGLLGMAFHPDWPATKKLFLSYTTNAPGPLTSRISSFEMAAGGDKLDPASEEVLFTLEQPYGNHNGGQISFGPDGYLYAGFGDGGLADDPHDNGQNPNTLLGTMIRLDVTGGSPYAIPPDNPFADGNGGKPEVYAWGLRNPWRFSFDRETGELWAGDVGQDAYEEISKIERGGNYGWNAKEGTHCFEEDPCDEGPWIDPVVDYPHAKGQSVTGGYVYRGDDLPSLIGHYVFADFRSGRIWGIFYDDQTGEPEMRELANTSHKIASFAQRDDGELYIIDYRGSIHRIAPPDDGGSENTFPQTLSATGCVESDDPTEPADGLIPYSVNAPFWSDGASKERYMALPEGESIETGGDAGWTLPVGSVLVKSFKLDGEFVETRLMVRHQDGNWAGYTYEWNDAETEATLLEAGKVKDLGDQKWVFPSRNDCQSCHTEAAGGSLGLKTGQLNGERVYPRTGRRANQLTTLDHIGVFAESMFDDPQNPDPSGQPAIPDPFGDAALSKRARAYLETNCSQCHQPGTAIRSEFDVRWTTEPGRWKLCKTAPHTGHLGVEDAKLLVPGNASKSLLALRPNRRDAQGMPPLASRRVDTRGVELLRNWIDGMDGCP